MRPASAVPPSVALPSGCSLASGSAASDSVAASPGLDASAPASPDTEASLVPASDVPTPPSIEHVWLYMQTVVPTVHGLLSQPFCAPSPSQSPWPLAQSSGLHDDAQDASAEGTHIESVASTIRHAPSAPHPTRPPQCAVALQLGWQKKAVGAAGNALHSQRLVAMVAATASHSVEPFMQRMNGAHTFDVPSQMRPGRQKGDATAGTVAVFDDEHGAASTPFNVPSPSQSPPAQSPAAEKHARNCASVAVPDPQSVTSGRSAGSWYSQIPPRALMLVARHVATSGSNVGQSLSEPHRKIGLQSGEHTPALLPFPRTQRPIPKPKHCASSAHERVVGHVTMPLAPPAPAHGVTSARAGAASVIEIANDAASQEKYFIPSPRSQGFEVKPYAICPS